MYPQLTVDKSSKPQVKIKTNMGDITCALFPKLAPKAAENFISLAKNGYYDGTMFHRVIKEFMIQGAPIPMAANFLLFRDTGFLLICLNRWKLQAIRRKLLMLTARAALHGWISTILYLVK